MKQGNYIKVWHDTVAFGVEPFYARILKINRVNVRVRDENGKTTSVTKEFALSHLVSVGEWHPEIFIGQG